MLNFNCGNIHKILPWLTLCVCYGMLVNVSSIYMTIKSRELLLMTSLCYNLCWKAMCTSWHLLPMLLLCRLISNLRLLLMSHCISYACALFIACF